MKGQTQPFLEEVTNDWDFLNKQTAIFRKKHEVVGVSNVIFYLEFMLHKLIKLVHVYIAEKLGSKIAKRQANSRSRGIETCDNSLQKP